MWNWYYFRPSMAMPHIFDSQVHLFLDPPPLQLPAVLGVAKCCRQPQQGLEDAWWFKANALIHVSTFFKTYLCNWQPTSFTAVISEITQIALYQDPKVGPESCHWNLQNSVENTAGFAIPCHTCRFSWMHIFVIRDVQEAHFFSDLGDDWCRPRRSCNDFS